MELFVVGIQSKYGKYGPQKTSYLDTFYAVIVFAKSPLTNFLTNELTKIFPNYIVNRHTQ